VNSAQRSFQSGVHLVDVSAIELTGAAGALRVVLSADAPVLMPLVVALIQISRRRFLAGLTWR
jgi:hypothetical protein